MFEYATDLFDRATIERMAGHFRDITEGIVAKAHRPIRQLPMLTAAEREQVLYGFNDSGGISPGLVAT